MEESSTVDIEISGSLANVTLNRPDSLNSFNHAMRRDVYNVASALKDDPHVRVVIISGAGRGFCAGADLTEQHPPGQTVEQRLNEQYKPLLTGIAESPKIWIAAVHGAAAGIGASLAMCCDLIVMDEEAYLFQAFSAIGLIPDGGLSLLLQRHLGSKRAFEVLALGEKLSASDCQQSGIANRVARKGNVVPCAVELADALLARAPLSLRYTKEVLRQVQHQNLADAITTEAARQQLVSQSDDHQEGRLAFREKRKPIWQGK